MAGLLVPIHVDALHLIHAQTVVGPMADFTRLPYFNGERDVNPDSPYISETILPKEFENETLTLREGVHLHWSLPDSLNKSIKGSNGKLFPAAPNRWLIKRQGPGTLDKYWIVESDYLWPEGEGFDSGSVSVPVPPARGDQGHPFRFMGRQMLLGEWLDEGEDPPHAYWHHLMPGNLTGLGWGHPAFDAFYPNCASVFGFFDPEIRGPITEDITYTVIGWYHKGEGDYLDYLTAMGIATDAVSIRAQLAWDIRHPVDGPYEGPNPGNLHCFCETTLKAGSHLDQTREELPEVCLAGTGTEAVSAYLASSLSTVPLEKTKIESQLEAILLEDRLKAEILDLGPRFEEMQHAKGFHASKGGTLWTIRLHSTNADQTEPQRSPELPEDIAEMLGALNLAQSTCDKAGFELADMITQLYSDWCKYMVCAYPEPGEKENLADMDEAREYIESYCIPRITKKKARTGTLKLPSQDANGHYQPYPGKLREDTLADTVRIRFNALQTRLAEINAELAEQKLAWFAQPEAAPGYWVPNEPVVLIAGNKEQSRAEPATVRVSERHGRDKDLADGLLPCYLLDKHFDTRQSREFFNVESILQLIDFTRSQNVRSKGSYKVTRQPWNPFLLEWKSEFFPAATGNPVEAGTAQYAPDYLSRNYLLGENETDFNDHFSLHHRTGIGKTGSIFQGHSILTASAGKEFAQKLDAFYAANSTPDIGPEGQTELLQTVHKAAERLRNFEILSQSLGGFNQALLQHHFRMRLPAADPIGFGDYREFAEKISAFLPGGQGMGPDLLSDFHPIRAGALKMLKLRLVDSFGRTAPVSTEGIHVAEAHRMEGQADWLRLSPRFAKATRVNFRWLAATGNQEMNDHPETGPICGWLLPNYLNNSLDAFNAGGAALGSIDMNGRWEPAVREGEPVTAADLHAGSGPPVNPHLRKVLLWLLRAAEGAPPDPARNEPGFFSHFISDLERVTENIHPKDYGGNDALIMLMGRPLAVVRASVNFEMKGLWPNSQHWTDFRNELAGGLRNTRSLEQVKVPIRIGEFRQMDDSLVGYWKEENEGYEGDHFHLNDSISAMVIKQDAPLLPNWPAHVSQTIQSLLQSRSEVRKQEFIQSVENGAAYWEDLVAQGWLEEEPRDPKIRHYADADTLAQSLADAPTTLTLLMDPHGKVHLSSGILPVKSINIPPKQYQDALRKIEVTFLTAPLLTPRSRFRMPIPHEEGYKWFWEQKKKGAGILEIQAAPRVNKLIFLEKLGKAEPALDAESAWTVLMDPAVAWLHNEAEGWAFLAAAAERKTQSLSAALAGKEAVIELILDQNHMGIDPVMTEARFEGPPELREGWIKLKSGGN